MTANLSAEDKALLASYLGGSLDPIEEKSRERVIATCEHIISSLRTPIETARKHAFLTLDQSVLRTAISLNLFPVLTAPGPHSTTFLAGITSPPCPPTLLRRLLRYLAQPLGLILETGPDEWDISPSGRVLADQSFSAGCKLYSDSCGPAFRALPSWVAQSSSPTRPATPFKASMMPHVDIDFFDWLRSDAGGLHDFHTWMSTLAQYQYDSQTRLDFTEWIPPNIASSETAFVDIGGGSGLQCMTLRQKSPDMHGRIVDQDRAEVVAEVASNLKNAGVETMAHDFFTEQPIKGT
jgi:demethylsterigmatocystin 6-O-methyltransferase